MTFRARDQIKINQKRKHFIFEGEDEHRWKWKNFLKKSVLWNRDWREKSWKLFGTGCAGWTDITLEVI